MRAIPDLDIGIVYDKPVLNSDQAKALILGELNGLVGLFDNTGNHQVLMAKVREFAVKQLGKDAINGYDASCLASIDPVYYLKSLCGYEVVDFSLPKDASNSRHLLECAIQNFRKNPKKDSIEAVINGYVNPRPTIQISGCVNSNFSKIKRLVLPRMASLEALGMQSQRNSLELSTEGYPNGRMVMHVRSVTHLGSPKLLDLQEYACDAVGLSFT